MVCTIPVVLVQLRTRGTLMRVSAYLYLIASSIQRRAAMVCLAVAIPCVWSVASAQGTAREARPLEEVVVTAQRREEQLQEVPISISVIGGDALDKSTAQGVTEALNQVAGVATTVGYQGGGTQVAVRGVTAGGALFNGSSPVAYYLDAVPFGLVKTAIAPDSNPYDLRQIEVLRGPQDRKAHV